MTDARYGMFGLTVDDLRRKGVTLLPEEARAVLDSLSDDHVRVTTRPVGKMVFPEVEILYSGRWLHMGRCDLFDHVRRSGRASVAEYREAIVYGARLDDDGFYVIDSMTDG